MLMRQSARYNFERHAPWSPLFLLFFCRYWDCGEKQHPSIKKDHVKIVHQWSARISYSGILPQHQRETTRCAPFEVLQLVACKQSVEASTYQVEASVNKHLAHPPFRSRLCWTATWILFFFDQATTLAKETMSTPSFRHRASTWSIPHLCNFSKRDLEYSFITTTRKYMETPFIATLWKQHMTHHILAAWRGCS